MASFWDKLKQFTQQNIVQPWQQGTPQVRQNTPVQANPMSMYKPAPTFTPQPVQSPYQPVPQKQYGLTPRNESFYTGIKDTGIAVARAIPQATLRVNMALTGEKSKTPTTKLTKFIYGDAPVKNFEGYGEDMTKLAEGLGWKNASKNKYANVALGLGLSALDATPFGMGKKKLAEELALAATETVTRKIALKNGLNLSEDAIKAFTAEKDATKIAKALQDAEKATKTVKVVEQATPLSNEAVKPPVVETPNPLGLTPEQLKTTTLQDFEKSHPTVPNVEPVVSPTRVRPQTPIETPQIKTPVIGQAESNAAAGQARYSTSEGTADFNTIFKEHIGAREAAGTTGAEAAYKMRNIPTEFADETIKALEGKAPANEFSIALRKEFDIAFEEAKKSGIDVNYIKDYVTHIWKESATKVEEAYRSAGKSFKYSVNRVLANYEEGIKLGLTPKYTHPGDILGHYVKTLEEAKANIAFFNKLKERGLIVPAATGANHYGFVPIIGQGFPKNAISYNGKVIIGQWYAPQEIAKEINKIFSPQDFGTAGKIAKVGASISGKAQDILLSGGVPGTALNAFTFAQGLKEVLAGRIKSPFSAIFKSLTDDGARQFFAENVETIKKMQLNDIKVTTNFDIGNLSDKTGTLKTFGEGAEDVWNKVVNEPTFKRFMPMLQVNLFNDIEKAALAGGKASNEATQVAAQAVKNFYGLGSNAKSIMAGSFTHDLKQALLFAPKYRESMVNFWVNNVKALFKNPLALENRANATFLVGAAAAYVTMDKINQHYNNGKHMWENPPGKKDKLLIPTGDSTVGVPFLSSIATVPRMAGAAAVDLATGNFKEAGKEAGGAMSMAFKPVIDVAKNENYFGQQIYDENAGAVDKLKASANYLLNPITGAYTHPYLREGIKYAQGKQDLTQTLTKATELPLRYYKTDTIDASYYYDNQKKIIGKLSGNDPEVYNRWYGKKAIKEDQNVWEKISKAADLIAHPGVLKAQTNIQIKTGQDTKKDIDPLYKLPTEQQLMVLKYQTLKPNEGDMKSKIIAENPWLLSFWDTRSKYFDTLGLKETTSISYTPTPEILTKQEEYFALPEGTGARKNFLAANPDLITHWEKAREAKNMELTDMGLPTIDNSSQSGGGSGLGYGSGKSFKSGATSITVGTAPKTVMQAIKAANISKLAVKAAPKNNAVSKKISAPKSYTAKATKFKVRRA